MQKRLAYSLLLGMCCFSYAWGTTVARYPDAVDDSTTVVRYQDSLDVYTTMELTVPSKDSLISLEGLEASLANSLLNRKTFTPDPIRAFWLSLIVPGAGQIYNHKYWKMPIVYGGFLGCVYALSWNGQMLKDYTQAYLDIMDDDPNTQSYMKMLPLGYDISGREDRFKDIFKRKKNYYRKYRDMSLFAFAGVYLISVIDAYVDAELSCFDISRDLSLKWEPSRLDNDNQLAQRFGIRTYGVQCSLNF